MRCRRTVDWLARWSPFGPALAVVAASLLAPLQAAAADPLSWPEEQRAFLQDGPGLLLTAAQRGRVAGATAGARAAVVAELMRDPLPATAGNELVEGIARRREVAFGIADSPHDVRWQLAFLRGAPAERRPVECASVFRPLEVWRYDGAAGNEARYVVVFQPERGVRWRLWDPPEDAKRLLYRPDMEHLMEAWEEQEGKRFRAERFDIQLCRRHAEVVDRATGTWALTHVGRRPRWLPAPLAPPPDLASWARAAAQEATVATARLPVPGLTLQFPARHGGERIVVRAVLGLPGESVRAGVSSTGEAQLRLALLAVVEHGEGVLQRVRSRFELPPPAPGQPLALAVELPLRPARRYLLRLYLRDEIGGSEVRLASAMEVPTEPQAAPDRPVPAAEIEELGERLASEPLAGRDALLLVPTDQVVVGRYRAEAIVVGERISRVVFSLDDRPAMTVNRPPFGVELDLGELPGEHVVRAEGFDAAGALVATAHLVLNEPRGRLRVRIVSPSRGAGVSGGVPARASVVVPEGGKVARVEFRLDDRLLATVTAPPWEWPLDPALAELATHLTVTACLEDGECAEDARLLTASAAAEVEVDLVELYVSAVDDSGRPVQDLEAADFTVHEDGRPQIVRRFERAAHTPLTVGVVLDASSSMYDRLDQAKQAAAGFLAGVVGPGDHAFVMSFADRPRLLVPPTEDVRAVADVLAAVEAYGNTALHDAVINGLYLSRGFSGQRALVVISDGDDSASTSAFRQTLEYARQSGVAVYTVGLGVDRFSLAIRNKLSTLAAETGGRAYFVRQVEELAAVYAEVGRELRTRYLLAYVSDAPAGSAAFRSVEVRAARPGVEVRTLRGYHP